MRAAGMVGAGAITLLVSVAPARADEPTRPPDARAAVELEWTAPRGCPDRAFVVAQMVSLLGQAPSTEASRPLRARARVRPLRRDEGWRLTLVATTPDGTTERHYAGPTCARLAEVAALVLAIAIDPEAVAANSEAPPPAEVVDPEPLLQARAEPPRLQALLRFDALADVGTLPSLAPGVGGAVGALLGIGRVEIFGSYWATQRVVRGPIEDSGGDIGLVTLGMRACLDVRAGALELGPCVAGEIGSMLGVGFGVTDPTRGRALWSAATLGLAASFRALDELALRLGIEGGVGLERPTFIFDAFGTVFVPSAAVVRGSVGVEWRLP